MCRSKKKVILCSRQSHIQYSTWVYSITAFFSSHESLSCLPSCPPLTPDLFNSIVLYLAVWCDNGEGVEQNEVNAAELYQKAMDKGNACAPVVLATLALASNMDKVWPKVKRKQWSYT
uniref:Uncharacterized protein n=1 Tax=Palpitomonas bilix TaxID=652834 RepID=A0A7S3CZJ7_9EUKA|mmetsp:Transcript_15769/g.40045  ORF Transcript_15769/g.40045 Transcript_15769/m.40045 type:complete len:118 (+) Transcript_15769:229-582(+)